MFVKQSFQLNKAFKKALAKKKAVFGCDGFGEVVYLRTYARRKEGRLENWGETVTRVTEGTFSILKSHQLTNQLAWDSKVWRKVSEDFATSMFNLEWSPPGRGLWAMGTDHVKNHGSTALNNCGFVDTTDLTVAATWAMDALMRGCGVGFNTSFSGQLVNPCGVIKFLVPDTREGWVESVRLLLDAFQGGLLPVFDYSEIRPVGARIHGFGGISSGYEPLEKLHFRILGYCTRYLGTTDLSWIPFISRELIEKSIRYDRHTYTSTRFVADVFNAIGACVVSGNVRRSSQIALGSPSDESFLNLKNLNIYPDRASVYWNSNNSVVLKRIEDFSTYIPDIARRIREGGNGEPGLLNLLNIQKYGRLSETKKLTREDEPDTAIGINPCGEIPLESFELCNVVETFPTRCVDAQGRFNEDIFNKACRHATLYATIVSLLPTNSKLTNDVVSRNHRIGVSVSGTSRLYEDQGYSRMIDILRRGHKTVRTVNQSVSNLCNVPTGLRVTTVKPSGTISKLAGVPEGLHFPLMGRYILRRMRASKTQALSQHLIAQGVPYEEDVYADNTYVFEFPIDQGPSRSINQVSVWEQIKVAELHQKFWSENSCSATFMYTPKEAQQLEEIISTSIPNLKSMCFAPQSDIKYQQAPVTAISQNEYLLRKEKMINFSLSNYDGNEGSLPLFCDGGSCEVEK